MVGRRKERRKERRRGWKRILIVLMCGIVMSFSIFTVVLAVSFILKDFFVLLIIVIPIGVIFTLEGILRRNEIKDMSIVVGVSLLVFLVVYKLFWG